MVERVRLGREGPSSPTAARDCMHGKSVKEYLTALKQIIDNCRFEPNEYGSRLRDVFVSGIRDICSRRSMTRIC